MRVGTKGSAHRSVAEARVREAPPRGRECTETNQPEGHRPPCGRSCWKEFSSCEPNPKLRSPNLRKSLPWVVYVPRWHSCTPRNFISLNTVSRVSEMTVLFPPVHSHLGKWAQAPSREVMNQSVGISAAKLGTSSRGRGLPFVRVALELQTDRSLGIG